MAPRGGASAAGGSCRCEFAVVLTEQPRIGDTAPRITANIQTQPMHISELPEHAQHGKMLYGLLL